ncbi:hypothetical protein [Lysobacter panacisoli]|nr:hypothetical protein [Lysobacter panacisoli]
MRAMVLSAALAILPGCSVVDATLSALFEPRASFALDVPGTVTTAQVFDCVSDSVAARPGRRGWMNTNVTRIDSARGVIETGDYARDNIVGLRSRTEFSPPAGRIVTRIRGGGPYFADLGIDGAALDLKTRLRDCLGPHSRANTMR